MHGEWRPGQERPTEGERKADGVWQSSYRAFTSTIDRVMGYRRAVVSDRVFDQRPGPCSESGCPGRLQRNMIELPKAERLLAARSTEPFAAWVTFFQHGQDEAIMSSITHPPVQQALDELKRLSADEEARHLAMLRERALRDEASFVRDAKAEGLTEGRTEVARRLIARLDLDDATIAELTGLGEDEVSRLRRSAAD